MCGWHVIVYNLLRLAVAKENQVDLWDTSCDKTICVICRLLVKMSAVWQLCFRTWSLMYFSLIILGKDSCMPNPCQHNGTCLQAHNNRGYHCLCHAGWRGYACERKYENSFSNSLIVHQVITKVVITVTVVWIPGLNQHTFDFISPFTP